MLSLEIDPSLPVLPYLQDSTPGERTASLQDMGWLVSVSMDCWAVMTDNIKPNLGQQLGQESEPGMWEEGGIYRPYANARLCIRTRNSWLRSKQQHPGCWKLKETSRPTAFTLETQPPHSSTLTHAHDSCCCPHHSTAQVPRTMTPQGHCFLAFTMPMFFDIHSVQFMQNTAIFKRILNM